MSRRADRTLSASVVVVTVVCAGGSRPSSPAVSTTVVTAVEPSVPQGFPVVIYPAPVPASTPNGVMSTCPSPVGIMPVAESERPAAVAAAQQFNSLSLDADLHNADPSLWPTIRAICRSPSAVLGGAS